MPATTHASAIDDLADELDKLAAPPTGIVPHMDQADAVDPKRLALARFLPDVARGDPRMRAANDTFERLVNALSKDHYRVSDALRSYRTQVIESVGPLALALAAWIDEITEIGDADLLGAIWEGDGLSDATVAKIIARSGVLEDAASVAKASAETDQEDDDGGQ